MTLINYRLSEAKEKIKEINNKGLQGQKSYEKQLSILDTVLNDSDAFVNEKSSILSETRKLVLC